MEFGDDTASHHNNLPVSAHVAGGSAEWARGKPHEIQGRCDQR